MYTGYITNQNDSEAARDYEAAILIWYKRLKSMYLPNSGFCLYPPEEGGSRKPDTYCAPLGTKHLLNLPTSTRSGIQQPALREMLDDIQSMVSDAANYYKIATPPEEVKDCHDAYQVIINEQADTTKKASAATFVRSRLKKENGHAYVKVEAGQPSYRLWGMAVSTREETAYAAAALFSTREPGDLGPAIAATNYLTAQLNEEGRLYSTVDSAACLALLIALRGSGIVASAEGNESQTVVRLNGQQMTLGEALAYQGKVEQLKCLEGVVTAQITSEVIEDWSQFKSELPVEVSLEQNGHKRRRYKLGDALDLVIRVPQYEPGLIAHVCLPDALARVVGGGQVKRFSLDFAEKNELRVPLAVVGTSIPHREEERNLLKRWLGRSSNSTSQRWAVIVRNMFKEEEVGNPGLLEVSVE